MKVREMKKKKKKRGGKITWGEKATLLLTEWSLSVYHGDRDRVEYICIYTFLIS